MDGEDFARRVRSQSWYHTLDLPGHTTPGWFDLRPYVKHYGLPERMDGMRVLDVGTWDGFWAWEMERRGAEVFALDVEYESELDCPPRRRPAQFSTTARGDGFRLAREMLGSQVQYVHRSIYEARPEELGTFDLVICGSVLVHLRDQLLALERIAALCRGTFVFADEYDRLTSLLPIPVARYFADRDAAVVFWLPSSRTWKRLMGTAGFDDVREHGRFRLRFGGSGQGEAHSVPHIVLHCSRSITAPRAAG